MDPIPTRSLIGLPGDSPGSLEPILCTDELNRRPSRSPDYEQESRALASLVRALADSPDSILQTLADTILDIFQADSAGVSLLTTHDGERRFYWPAIAGAWKRHIGDSVPRERGPRGDLLDRDGPLLFKRFEPSDRHLPHPPPAAEEVLLAPVRVRGQVVGTIWATTRDDRKRFDLEDVRRLELLARFTAAAYPIVQAHRGDDSRDNARRAALNLMEDAVQARRAMETLNAQLGASERRLRELIDALPAAVYTTDAQGRLTHFNAAAVELAGRTPELGSDAWCVSWKLFHSDGTPLLPDEYPMAIALNEGRELRGVEAILERPDGTRRWFTPYPTRLRDDAGVITGGINMLVDITERKQAEQAALHSERRFRALVEQVKDYAIFSVDVEGRATSWNQGVQRILGFDEPDFIGRDIVANIFLPEDVERGVAQHELDVAAAESSAGDDRWMLRRSGERFYANGVTTALRDESGALLGFIKVMRDMTERKRIEQDLRDSEDRFRALADNMSQLAWIADARGNLSWYNKRWYDYTGTSFEEVKGWSWKKVHHPDHVERVVELWQRAVATGEPFDDTFPLRGKDGEYRWFLSRARPTLDKAGDTLLWFGTNTDVTEQREMEAKIRQQAEDLTGESRRKDEFLAMLSHELRNPLAPIRSALYVLKMRGHGSEDAIQQRAREIIERQVGNLTKIVSDLLEVSRVVSGRIRLELQTVDLNQILEHAVETVRPLVDQHGHELALNLGPAPIWAHGDPTRLEEVFINLLNNAAKYTPDGGRIEVWCDHDQGRARIRVRDNGVGIDAELLPRIFDLFTQADRSLARSSGGLGIGLSLAHRLAELHGGTLEAHSPPEAGARGSEFIVRLTLARAPDSVQPSAAANDIAPGAATGVRVLLVDDNIDQVTMLAGALRHTGYSVQTAHNGPDGLNIAQEWRPDVVLLDIGLPGLSGYEVARRLRTEATPELRQAKMIALTGYGRDTDIDLAREAGFDAHLTKPFDVTDLEALMATPNPGMTKREAPKR